MSGPERGKIAILLPSLVGGGVERVRILLAHEFLRRGYAVEFVLALPRGVLLDQVPAGCSLYSLEAKRLRWVVWKLRRYLIDRRPDAVLAAMWPLSALAGIALRLSGTGIRLVVSEHNDLREAPAIRPLERVVMRTLGKWLYSRASGVVAISHGVRDSIVELTGMRRERISVINNPVRGRDETEESVLEAEDSAWWDRSPVKLIAVGSLKPQKDYPTLLNAIARVRAVKDVRLLVLGEGNPAEFERMAERLGIHEAVRFAGFRANPYAYLRAADLFVLSSRWEGLGNVITEALLCGCPVVATDCRSGPAELLGGGRLGRLVPPGEPEALADAIIAALAEEHDPRPGMEWASRFAPPRAADAYLELMFSGAEDAATDDRVGSRGQDD